MSADSAASAAGAVEVTDAAALGRIVEVFRDLLVSHRATLNALNVYPVPDGDTGTNMSLTLTSVVEALDGVDDDLDAVCGAIAHGSLMGARGNSGVILSQILRGLTSVLADHGAPAGADAWSRALSEAATAAYGAVLRPVEGTILTVVREAAEAAASLAAGEVSLADVLAEARREGGASLSRTPELLPALADAGVVDAGAAGFLLLLDAARNVVAGVALPEPDEVPDAPPVPVRPDAAPSDGSHDVSELRYEVMFFLDAPDDSVEGFKAAWGDIGDSIVVVGGDGIWNCHIHCDDIGAAIEAGIAVGRPHRIRVTDLFEEVDARHDPVSPAAVEAVSLLASAPATTAVVAVAVGDGVRRIFESLGVQAVVTGGQTMNPSTDLLAQAVAQVAADNVVILPNNKNIIAVAERVDEVSDKSVGVVPTRSIAEGFAALLAYDPGASLVTNVGAMSDAGGAVDAGEVCQAVRASRSEAGEIAEGDWLGLTRRGIVAVAPTLAAATCAMLDDLVDADHELVTLIRGVDADDVAVEEVTAWLGEHRPDVEVEVHDGGQPLYAFHVGVE